VNTSSNTPAFPGTTGVRLAAWKSPRAWAVLVLTTVLSVVFDLWTKYWAFSTLHDHPVNVVREDVVATTPQLWQLIPPHAPRVIVPSLLEFKLVLNPGAVFGIGAGKRWFFVVFTCVALGVCLTIFSRWTKARDWLAHIALGLVLGGGLGNLYDRVQYACVRDFIHPLPDVLLPFGWSWPWGGRDVWPYVSNVADALLIVGVAYLAWMSFRAERLANSTHTKPRAEERR
jgi:signal peptidase II